MSFVSKQLLPLFSLSTAKLPKSLCKEKIIKDKIRKPLMTKYTSLFRSHGIRPALEHKVIPIKDNYKVLRKPGIAMMQLLMGGSYSGEEEKWLSPALLTICAGRQAAGARRVVPPGGTARGRGGRRTGVCWDCRPWGEAAAETARGKMRFECNIEISTCTDSAAPKYTQIENRFRPQNAILDNRGWWMYK